MVFLLIIASFGILLFLLNKNIDYIIKNLFLGLILHYLPNFFLSLNQSINSMRINRFFCSACGNAGCSQFSWAQVKVDPKERLSPIVKSFVDEVNNNSQLENLASELLDGIGPRLVGTPEMLAANEWSANKLLFPGSGCQSSTIRNPERMAKRDDSC